jgi:predicted ATP-grasp superfamily ATP-dependent carboligase
MLSALAADFAALEGVSVHVLNDVRYDPAKLSGCTTHSIADADEHRRRVVSLAAGAAWTVVIAPEFGGLLLEQCRAVERAGGRLLCPGPALVELAGDKHTLAQHLLTRGVPAPRGLALPVGAPLPTNFRYPGVLKPRDGAGSWGVERLAAWSDRRAPWPARLEQVCPGIPASVAVLCGPGRTLALTTCRQRLGGVSGFEYQGGELPLAGVLGARAEALALRAIGALAAPLGYVGVDVVLGADPAGADDFVIEVNPRLTTSYVGLRQLCTANLAGAMLALAAGREVQLSWRGGSIQFDASGAWQWSPDTSNS